MPSYREVRELNEVARYHSAMDFFRCGENHHDLGLTQSGPSAPRIQAIGVGPCHLAFKGSDSLDEPRAFPDHLVAKGVPLAGKSDHRVSLSHHAHDRDGMSSERHADNVSVCLEG